MNCIVYATFKNLAHTKSITFTLEGMETRHDAEQWVKSALGLLGYFEREYTITIQEYV